MDEKIIGFTKSTLPSFITKMRQDVSNKSIQFKIDNANSRIGLKYGSETNFTYTDPIRGRDGESVTDIYVDPDTDDIKVVISDTNSIGESVIADYYKTEVKNIDAVSVTVDMDPNIFYRLGVITSLTATMNTPTNSLIANEYMLEFETGDEHPTIVFESSIIWVSRPEWKPNMKYQVSILDNIGIAVGVPITTNTC